MFSMFSSRPFVDVPRLEVKLTPLRLTSQLANSEGAQKFQDRRHDRLVNSKTF
jgi:hypothetical protein